MSYRKLDNIDEAIVKATITIGGSKKASRGFAIKEIAERCSVSEYVIFRHFTTNQTLMSIADKSVGHLLASEAKTLRKNLHRFRSILLPLPRLAISPQGADVLFAQFWPWGAAR